MKTPSKDKMLLVLGLMFFCANGDNYAAASLLSDIAEDLNIPLSGAALSVTAYMTAMGICTLIFGPLSDRFGKVRIINIAAFGTAVFSILGAVSFNLPSLAFFRTMNGICGAGIFPITLALVGESFDASTRQRALGKVTGLGFLGAATATAIGGSLAYFVSWRFVYFIYGFGELVLALVMARMLPKDVPAPRKTGMISAYKGVLTNFRFVRLVILYFFVGFSVFGSFTYSGVMLQESTPFNILIIGLILSSFGLGTVLGGRLAPPLRGKTGNGFLVITAVLGYLSLTVLSGASHVFLSGIGLLGLGTVFIFIHSTLLSVIQEQRPDMNGTAMSIAGFNLYLGGACGTYLNATVMKVYGIETIFHNASFIFPAAALLAAIFVARFEIKRKQGKFCSVKKILIAVAIATTFFSPRLYRVFKIANNFPDQQYQEAAWQKESLEYPEARLKTVTRTGR